MSIEGFLVDVTLSMPGANYRKKTINAGVHPGFDLDCTIPSKIYLGAGKGKVLKANPINSDGIIFFDAMVAPGGTVANQAAAKAIRLNGYEVNRVKYGLARHWYHLTTG